MIVMAARYQLYKDVAGKFRFRLRAANNRIVVVSQAYEQHEGALNGVESIQNNCTVGIEDLTVDGPRMNYPKYQVFLDKASEFRFRLTASNGQIIGASEGYETKESCLNGIKAVQASCGVYIEDLTSSQEAAPAETTMGSAIEGPAVAMGTAPSMAPPMGMGDVKLELYKLPDTVAKGDVVYFKGKLSKGEMGVPKVKIRIFEHDRSFMFDGPSWAEGYTIEDGSFNLAAKVVAPHFWDNSAKIYAQVDGDKIKHLRSDIQKIVIK
jgi:uncharacterized protein YegP (UPF0339 family)